MVVAHRPIALQDGIQHRLPVDAIFQRLTHIHIVERRHIHMHGNGVVPRAVGLKHLQLGIALQQMHRLELALVHEVDLAGLQRIGARRHIIDADHMHLVEMRLALAEIVRIAAAFHAHPRLPTVENIGAGASALLEVGGVGRLDGEVIVAQGEAKIGVAVFQHDDHFVLAVGAHFIHLLQQGFGRRIGTLAAMPVERLDDILGLQRLAIVELHAAMQLESPGGGIGRSIPGFRQLRHQLGMFVIAQQRVAQQPLGGQLRHGIRQQARVQRIRRRRPRSADPQQAADLGGLRRRRLGKQLLCSQGRNPQRRRPGHEGAPRQASLDHLIAKRLQRLFRLFHLILLPMEAVGYG